ncbi:MAG TPA: phosphotransferase [Streptosporangiaceae bacterium]|nr:phosphotransferase [Streptosporangiaceae bacterium]
MGWSPGSARRQRRLGQLDVPPWRRNGGGQLAAVIDFGTCGVGDPACDLAMAWTLLTADGRQTFRKRLPADEGEWARGRGWALWKTLATWAGTLGDDDEEAASARRAFRPHGAGAGTRRGQARPGPGEGAGSHRRCR